MIAKPTASAPGDSDIAARRCLEDLLPPALSVIAGMVDLTGFFMLGHVFTAHITGNLVVASAAAVDGGPVYWAQLAALPMFASALALLWLIARLSKRRGVSLVRLLLGLQTGLLAAVLLLCVTGRLSAAPQSPVAGIAVLLAVAAMASQYALLRLALPQAVSTAVMTGNLANVVLGLMDALTNGHPLMRADDGRLRRALHLLGGFLTGCLVAALAMPLMREWAWVLPVALAAVLTIHPLLWADAVGG